MGIVDKTLQEYEKKLPPTQREDDYEEYPSYRMRADSPEQREISQAEDDVYRGLDENKGVWEDITTGVKESPYQIAGGIADFGNEVWDAMMVDDAMSWFDGKLKKWLPPKDVGQTFKPTGALGRLVENDFKKPLDTTEEAQSTTGNIIRKGTQFMVGFLPLLGQVSKGTKLLGVFKNSSKAKAFFDATVAGFPIDYAGFNPNEPNLSNLAARVFADNEAAQVLEDYLGTDPNDSEALNRLRNGLQGVLLGGAFEGVFAGTKAVKNLVTKLTKHIVDHRNSKAFQEIIAKSKPAGKAVKAQAVAEEGAEKSIAPKVTGSEATASMSDEEMESAAKNYYDNQIKQIDEAANLNPRKPFDKVDGVPDAKLKDVIKHHPEQIAKVKKALAEGKLSATREMFDINLDRIDSEETVKEVINTFAEHMKPLAKDVPVTHEQLSDLAIYLGTSEGKVAQLFKNTVGDQLSAQVLATRNFLALSSENVVNKVRIAVTTNSPEALLEMNKAILKHSQIQSALSGIKTEIARTLNAMKIKASSANARAAAVDSMISMMGGRELNYKYAQRLLKVVTESSDPEDALRALALATRKTKFQRWRDAHLEMYINGLLSKPVTQIVNATGNASTIVLSLAERKIAETFSKAGAGGVAKGETAAMINGMLRGLNRGWTLAKKAWKTGEPSDLATKTDVRAPFQKAISAEALEASGTIGKAIDYIGHITRVPGKLLMSADEFFKTINVDMQRHALAYRKVHELGLTGEDYVKAYTDIVTGLDTKISLEADNFAKYNTFTNDLPENSLSRGAQNLLNHDMTYGLGRAFVPFFRTPVNILKFVGHRTPLVRSLSGTIKAELNSSDLAVRQLAHAKLATGSMIYTTGLGLAMSGVITGSEPVDPLERRRLRATGWRPYSIHLPGIGYMPYNRFDPIGLMLGISADLYQGSSLMISAGIEGHKAYQETGDLASFYEQEQMERYQEAAGLGLMAIYSQLADRHYVAGVATIFDLLQGEKSAQKKAFEQQFVGMLPPFSFYSSLRRGVVDSIDPVIRDVNGPHVFEVMRDIVYRQIPLISEEVRPTRNLLGEPRLKTGNDLGMAWRPFNNLFNPLKLSTETPNKLEMEVERLQITEGDPMTTHSISTGIRGEGPSVPLEKEEKDFFQVEYGKLNRKLQDWMTTNSYRNLDDMQKRKRIIYRLNVNRDRARALTMNKFRNSIRERVHKAKEAEESNLLEKIQNFQR